MEFLGKMVKKEFKGFGVFDGVVDSYDSTTGFFKIMYEDGDSEEADFSEVERLVSASAAAEVSTSGDPIPAEEKAPAKRAGRKPKRRRRNFGDPGKGSENLVFDCSLEQSNLEGIEHGIGGNLANAICVSANRNLNDNGLDLNRGLNFDDGVEKVEIDLNLTVVSDEFDEGVEKGKKERNFDLNLGLTDENLNGVNDVVEYDTCAGLADELQNRGGVACESLPDLVVNANHVDSNGGSDVKLEGRCPDVVSPSPCEVGVSGRRKRRKVTRNLTSPTETVLRRSARRAKAIAMNECNSPGVMSVDGANDLSMSGVTEESEEKLGEKDLGRAQEPWVLPPQIELPPSSTNLNLEGIPVLDLFFVYSCLRSFSTLLYLSPFALEDLVAVLKSRVSNLLIDFIHVSVLQTLRKHLEFLANEGSESASTCLRNMNWDLLDVITWPVFMVEYLLIHGSGLKPSFSLDKLNLFDGEYYIQPAKVKLELLRCLCDDVIEVDATRSELGKRMIMADATMEIDRTMSNDLYRKRRISSGAHGDALDEDMLEDVADGNSDECCLCKMDGNLICCDGCPAAYHTKCVGIVSTLLPEGEWYCPECKVGKFNLGTKPQKLIRGADLLGIDPYGRLFFSCFNYLLVSDSYDAESSFNYYHKDDLGAVVQRLRSYDIIYESILNAISQQWLIPTDLHEPKSSSEGSAEVLQSNQLIPDSPRPSSSEIGEQVGVTNSVSVSKERKRGRPSAGRPRSFPKTKEEDVIQGQGRGNVYTNCYSFARTASSVVEELLRKPSDKVGLDIPKTEEEIISIQSKFILRKSTKFCWPTNEDLDANRQKEKCGWCYCCRFPVEGRECLFSLVNKGYVAGGLNSEVDAVLLKKSKKGHLVDIICCLLYMEQRLRGLLLGPWLSPSYGELWRKSVIKASDVSFLKHPLLTLESNLHPLALSADWWKHVDSVATMGSASHYVASLRGASKNGINRRKGRCGDSEIKSLVAAGGLGLFWWRGGKVSRSLFNWKVVPRSLALKAARNAGRVKIPVIQYPDGSENAKRSRGIAWRAAVETSTSLEQLALQIRELDLFLRWDDIENTHPHSVLDKESIKSIRLFKKAIVRRKCVEGTLVKYLLDFGKRRSVPDVVIKHGVKIEEPSGEKKKYWLDESHVPLHLLKSFEERRITRKASKTNSSKAGKSGRLMKKLFREKGFDYLFLRAERADSHQCGHCNKHVPISEAVSCQHCNGFFHKRHVTRSSEAITSDSTYTCHRCRAGKHVKHSSIQGKAKRGKLQDVKNLKVESRGRLGRLRGKPCGIRKIISSSGVTLLGKNKKVQYQKKCSSQENAYVYSGMTLRRSARKATHTPVQFNSSAGGKKRGRKRKKSKNVKPKETPKSSCCQKRSVRVVCSFWMNGVLFSNKPNDERVGQFKRRKVFVPSEFSAGIGDPPKCSLCSEQEFVSTSLYIACELCGDWFHGDAFGLNEGNVERVIGFKCHICREKSPPVCPSYYISRDTNEAGTQNAGGSSNDICVQKETDFVPDMCSDEVYSTGENIVGKFEKVDNSAVNVDHDKSPIVDSELRLENGSSVSQKTVANAIENHSGDGADVSSDHLQEFPPDGAPQGCLEDRKVENFIENHDLVTISILDSSLAAQNSSPTSEEVTANAIEIESGKRVDVLADCMQEFSDNVSPGHVEGQTVKISAGCLDHKSDPELRVDNGSCASKEVKANVIGGQNGNLKADVLTDHDCECHYDGVSLGCSEVQTVQPSFGNLDQLRSPTLVSELRVENGSPDSNKVISKAIGSQSRDLKAGLSTACVSKRLSNDISVNCIEIQIEPNSELRMRNGSPASKEIICNAIESQSGDLKADLSTACVQKFLSNGISVNCLDSLNEPNSVGNLDQIKTSMLDTEFRVENGSSDGKEIESQNQQADELLEEAK